jgi:hypothetical protein
LTSTLPVGHGRRRRRPRFFFFGFFDKARAAQVREIFAGTGHATGGGLLVAAQLVGLRSGVEGQPAAALDRVDLGSARVGQGEILQPVDIAVDQLVEALAGGVLAGIVRRVGENHSPSARLCRSVGCTHATGLRGGECR